MRRLTASQVLAIVLLAACLAATIAFDSNDVQVAGASLSDLTGPVAIVLLVYLVFDLRRARRTSA